MSDKTKQLAVVYLLNKTAGWDDIKRKTSSFFTQRIPEYITEDMPAYFTAANASKDMQAYRSPLTPQQQALLAEFKNRPDKGNKFKTNAWSSNTLTRAGVPLRSGTGVSAGLKDLADTASHAATVETGKAKAQVKQGVTDMLGTTSLSKYAIPASIIAMLLLAKFMGGKEGPGLMGYAGAGMLGALGGTALSHRNTPWSRWVQKRFNLTPSQIGDKVDNSVEKGIKTTRDFFG